MTKLWCKLFNFILRIFENAVEAVAWTIKTVGTVLVDIASTVLDAAAGAIDSLIGSPGGILLIGLGIFVLVKMLGASEEEEPPRKVGVTT